jgi:hypothetical protein
VHNTPSAAGDQPPKVFLCAGKEQHRQPDMGAFLRKVAHTHEGGMGPGAPGPACPCEPPARANPPKMDPRHPQRDASTGRWLIGWQEGLARRAGRPTFRVVICNSLRWGQGVAGAARTGTAGPVQLPRHGSLS